MIKYFPVKVWKLCSRGLIHILYFSCGLMFMGTGFVSRLAGMWRSGTAGIPVRAVCLQLSRESASGVKLEALHCLQVTLLTPVNVIDHNFFPS